MTRVFRLILIAVAIATFSTTSFGAVFVSVNIAPPVLPVYTQPVCPGPGYIWVPGYWAYGEFGYYWVPGTWVLAPFVGALWTPGYWGWGDGVYLWHEGSWGLSVGFYGGINYGFGYPGVGYDGGYWNRGAFYYNRAVNHVDPVVVHNVYNKPVINRFGSRRVSFNGGHGGTSARPTAAEMAAARTRRMGPAPTQAALRRDASTNRGQRASVNHGRPSVVATRTPAEFRTHAAPRGATANRAGGTSLGNRTVRRTSPATQSRQMANAHANRTPANTAMARRQRGALPLNVPHGNAQARRTPTAPAMHGGRSVAQRPAQHPTSAPHSVTARRAPQPNSAAARRAAPNVPQYSARNNTQARPSTPHNRALAQPSHRTAPPPSHYMAQHSNPAPRAAAPAPRAVQPHQSAPRAQSAPAHNAAPRREGGRG